MTDNSNATSSDVLLNLMSQSSGHGSPAHSSCVLTDQERFLPIACVARIMKRMVPEPGKVAKETKECCQECVSEFIHFISSEAAERSAVEKRKTITGDDILTALITLGFDNYVDPLRAYLLKYRDAMKGEQPLMQAPGSSQQQHYVLQQSSSLEQTGNVVTEPDGTVTVQLDPSFANSQNMIYVDPTSKKNYIMVPGRDGQVQLLEVVQATAASTDDSNDDPAE